MDQKKTNEQETINSEAVIESSEKPLTDKQKEVFIEGSIIDESKIKSVDEVIVVKDGALQSTEDKEVTAKFNKVFAAERIDGVNYSVKYGKVIIHRCARLVQSPEYWFHNVPYLRKAGIEYDCDFDYFEFCGDSGGR